MDFSFTNEYGLGKVDEIVAYLLGPRLWIPRVDYPDYFDWAQKVHKELKGEKKRAIIALDHKELVGVMVYQRHRKYADCLELKNLTVRPDLRGRYIASFLLRNAEVEGSKEYKVNKIICDTKAANLAVRFFLEKHNYKATAKIDLYRLKGGDDIVFTKRLVRFPNF